MYLKFAILYKLLKDDLQTAGYHILLNLVQKQDKMGYVNNVHYLDVAEETQYSRATVNHIFHELERKNYIRLSQLKQNGFYDITIIDNFQRISKGVQYLNLNDVDFTNGSLRSLSKASLKLFLYGKMHSYTSDKKQRALTSIKVDTFCSEFMLKSVYHVKQLINKIHSNTKMVIRFDDDRKNMPSALMYLNSPKSPQKAFAFDDYLLYYHKIKSFCKGSQIDSFTDDDLSDTVKLINQYHKKIDPAKLLNFIIEQIRKRRTVDAKYIHFAAREQFAL